MKKFKEKLNKTLHKKIPPSLSAFNREHPFITLPLELHFLIVELLPNFHDVLALSSTSRHLYSIKWAFLNSFTRKNHPTFLIDSQEENPATQIEQIRRQYALKKLEYLHLDQKLVKSAAATLCQMKSFNGLEVNWKTLLTAASLGDIQTCIHILGKEKLDIPLGCYAVMSVMNLDFLAPIRCHSKLSPQKYINNENLVYTLLFKWPKGKKMFKAAKKIGFEHIALMGDKNVELLHADCLSAHYKGKPEFLEPEQELLIGAISASYFKVTHKLIKAWKIKPKIPAMARLFIQVTRHPPNSVWQTLFATCSKDMPLRARKTLVTYFHDLEYEKEWSSLIQERGYKALIPELQSLLKISVNYTVKACEEEILIQNTVETGKIARLNYLLEERKMDLHWLDRSRFAWEALYTADPDTAEAMLANLIDSKALSTPHKDEIVTTLLEQGHLKSIMQAYSLNQKATSTFARYEKEEKITHYLQALSFRDAKKVIKQALQGGYLDLLTQLESSNHIYQTLELGWMLRTIIKADRYNTMQWFLNREVPDAQKNLQKAWKIILHETIAQDKPNIFAASLYHLGTYKTWNYNVIIKTAIQYSSTKIIKYLITKQPFENYEALAIECLEHLLKGHDQLASTDPFKACYIEWFPIFETLLKKHITSFTLDWPSKLYQFIQTCNPFVPSNPTAWLELLLSLLNALEQDIQKHTALYAGHHPTTITQYHVLHLLMQKYINDSITIENKWAFIAKWLDDKYPHFALNDNQKALIKEQVAVYLMEQELLYTQFPDYQPCEEGIESIVEILENLRLDDKKSQHIITALVVKVKRYDLLQRLIELFTDMGVNTLELVRNNYRNAYIGYSLLGDSGKQMLNEAANLIVTHQGSKLYTRPKPIH